MTRILIVEDEPNMVAGLRDNFEFEGYEVLTAYDGEEGLNAGATEVVLQLRGFVHRRRLRHRDK